MPSTPAALDQAAGKGSRLLALLASPIGEAVTDALLGTVIATGPLLLHTDNPPQQEALQMAGTAAGGLLAGIGGHAIGHSLADRYLPTPPEFYNRPEPTTLIGHLTEPMPRGRLAGRLIADLIAGGGMLAGWQAGTALAHQLGADRRPDGTVSSPAPAPDLG